MIHYYHHSHPSARYTSSISEAIAVGGGVGKKLFGTGLDGGTKIDIHEYFEYKKVTKKKHVLHVNVSAQDTINDTCAPMIWITESEIG